MPCIPKRGNLQVVWIAIRDFNFFFFQKTKLSISRNFGTYIMETVLKLFIEIQHYIQTVLIMCAKCRYLVYIYPTTIRTSQYSQFPVRPNRFQTTIPSLIPPFGTQQGEMFGLDATEQSTGQWTPRSQKNSAYNSVSYLLEHSLQEIL